MTNIRFVFSMFPLPTFCIVNAWINSGRKICKNQANTFSCQYTWNVHTHDKHTFTINRVSAPDSSKVLTTIPAKRLLVEWKGGGGQDWWAVCLSSVHSCRACGQTDRALLQQVLTLMRVINHDRIYKSVKSYGRPNPLLASAHSADLWLNKPLTRGIVFVGKMTWSQNWRLFRLSGRLEASMNCCFWACRKAINWFDSKTKLTSVFCITKCLIRYLLKLESKLYFDEFEWRAQHGLNICTEI